MSLFHSPRIVTDELVLCLDAGNPKSYPVTPELITNGTFNSNVNGWTAFNSTNTWSSGKMQITRSGGTGATTYQTFTTIAGQTYIVTAEVNSLGSRGDLRIRDGTGWGGSSLLAINGTNAQTVTLSGNFTAISTETTLGFAVDGNGTSIVVDNISISPSSPLWADLSGNGYTGILRNSVTYNSSNGGYFIFDGTDTAITTDLTRDNDNFSYSVWFQYGGGTGERNIIDTYEVTSTEWTRLNVSNGRHRFYIDNDNVRTDLQGSIVQTNVWYNSVGTWDPSTGEMKLYVNGELDAQRTKTETTTISGLSNLFIGARSSSNYTEEFIGNIACVYVYSKTLTPQEVQQNYLALKSRYIN